MVVTDLCNISVLEKPFFSYSDVKTSPSVVEENYKSAKQLAGFRVKTC